MTSDPRRKRDNNAPILLAGDDAMDEDEDLFDEPIGDDNQQQLKDQDLSMSGSSGVGGANLSGVHIDLISTIITPSPFAHHTTGPTSSRYRNALQRITAHPQTDTEAWQALLTEVSTCWKSLQMTKNIHALDAETQLQLDWIESCYGAFLKYFPYSFTHYVAIGDILFVQSARVGEEGGPATDYGGLLGNTQRAQQAQAKLETILRETLGFDLEGNPPEQDEDSGAVGTGGVTTTVISTDSVAAAALNDAQGQTGQHQLTKTSNTRKRKILSVLLGGMCTSSVELWLLYIKARIRYAKRKYNYNNTTENVEAAKAVLEESKQAYELALEYAGFTCFDNQILWKDYLNFCKSQVPPSFSEQERNASLLVMTPQQHMLWLRSIYQKLVCNPMTGLDQLWQEYETFERQQSEALAAALIQELQPKYQHARNVYLDRNKVFNVQDLQWKTRLAVPPVSSSKEEDDDSDGASGSASGTGIGAGTAGNEGKKKTDDAGGGGDEETVQEYQSKMRDEFDYLTLWKKRCAFERTNPDRLTSPQELAHRVRQAYKEMICILTWYPEAWHMWSMWEDTLPVSAATHQNEGRNRAIAVLELGQGYIPDSALLVLAQAQLVEIHAVSSGTSTAGDAPFSDPKTHKSSAALKVLEKYLERAPTSLGFCLYQRLVRRYKGMEAARTVFAKARRVLTQGKGDIAEGVSGIHQNQHSEAGSETPGTGSTPGQDSTGGEDPSLSHTTDDGKRWMVTNRLDPSVGTESVTNGKAKTRTATKHDTDSSHGDATVGPIITPGPITWHLYACHASIEHRLNKSPEIAARIYELGLRKHSSFLTKPSYVIKYARLLLELQDTVNLRALLTRALAACGDSKNNEQVETLWDMTLQCEEMWSIADPTNIEVALSVERRRRAALFGPEIEDVATGSRVGLVESGAPVGMQKSTLAEQLNRTDGYDTSSLIVNGLSRTVDVLDVMGLWGDGSAGRQYLTKSFGDDTDEMIIPGGKSDKSYQRRLQFARRLGAGFSLEAMAGGEAGSKLVSARERLQQQTPGFQNTPIQLAIQQMPEFLRSMLLILPASRLRSSIVPKVPPHMVEMALTSLRQSKLPDERPNDGSKSDSLSGTKRSADSAQIGGGGGDSSDEETGPRGTGGYGSQFRARQRARIATNGM